MKNGIYFILLLLCMVFFSCKSLTQPNNESPTVSISANNSVISIGDTLKLTIRASDSVLKNGNVSFGDGTTITFSNLKSKLDTTIVHNFISKGNYNVTVSFSDEENTTTKELAVTVADRTAPSLSITANSKTITLGDTLKIRIRVTDTITFNGYLNFGDGTVFNFSNLKGTFDTTIAHLYTELRLDSNPYIVTTEFGNSYKSISNSLSITTNIYFRLSFAVGTVWKFTYQKDFYSSANGSSGRTRGKHEWRIISSTETSSDTIFTVRETKADSVFLRGYGLPEFAMDTTSSTFKIVVSKNSISFGMLEQSNYYKQHIFNILSGILPYHTHRILEVEVRKSYRTNQLLFLCIISAWFRYKGSAHINIFC